MALHLIIGGKFPWVRSRVEKPRPAPAVDTPPHRCWVITEHGVGWLDHHDSDGYHVRLKDNTLVQVQEFWPAGPEDIE